MGVDANFGILQPVDIGGNFQQAFKQGQEARRERETRNALAAYAKDPTSPDPVNALLAINPALGFQLQSKQREDAAYRKDQAFEGALGKFYQSRRGDPLNTADVADMPGRPANPNTGQGAAPGLPMGVQPVGGQSPMPAQPLPASPIGAQPVGGQPVQQGGALSDLDNVDPAQFPAVLEAIDTISQLIQIADNPGKWDVLAKRMAAQEPSFQQYIGQFGRREEIVAELEQSKAELQQRIGGGAPAQQSDGLDELYQIDPIRAEKIKAERSTEKLASVERELKIMQAVDSGYDLAIERLSTATDETSYQRALSMIDQRFAPLGVDVRETAPANYPGPDGIRQLLQSSMDAKEQIAAQDRQLRLENDIADDAADNARADRNTGNMIDVRNRRVGISAARESRIASKPKGGPKRKAKSGQPTATDAKGRRVAWNGKGWVPVQ
jgi:hypothetical protein